LLAGQEVDAVVVVMALSRAAVLERERDDLERVLASATVPVVLYSRTQPSPDSIELLQEMQLPWTRTPRRAARLLAGLVAAGQMAPAAPVIPSDLATSSQFGDAIAALAPLTEASAKAVLKSEGLPVGAGRLVTELSEGLALADEIGFPLALKVQSTDLPHKTELGLIELGIDTPEELAEAYAALVERVAEKAPDAPVAGVLIERMADPGVEMIVGVVDEADFGPLIMLGTGGIHAEILDDAVFALAPLSPDEARRMVDSLKGLPLLEGARGVPPADRAALEELLVSVSNLAAASRSVLSELDLNPVRVHPAGEGVTIVDAWIGVHQTPMTEPTEAPR
jgi:acetate---CoA ligase (ADP-forming)